ncbi:MAG: hypothetical protein ACRC10_03280 [Thermoguttaceae bacterium]
MNCRFSTCFVLIPPFSLLLFTLSGCSAQDYADYPPSMLPGVTVEVIEYEPMYPAAPKTKQDDLTFLDRTLQEPTSVHQVPTLAQYGNNAAESEVRLPPIADLEPQVEQYVARLKKALDDLDGSVRFADDAEVLYRDASTLSMIALALALSPEKSKYKEAAPGIIQTAEKLQSVKSIEEATEVVAALEKAMTSQSTTVLTWKKIAPLKPLMKAVPNINTLIKRNLRTEAALKKGDKKVLEGSAALAVIAQGSLPNVAETIKPDAEKEWKSHCREFRDAALKVNQTTRSYMDGQADYEAVEATFEKLTDSCNSCHTLFFSGTISLD